MTPLLQESTLRAAMVGAQQAAQGAGLATNTLGSWLSM